MHDNYKQYVEIPELEKRKQRLREIHESFRQPDAVELDSHAYKHTLHTGQKFQPTQISPIRKAQLELPGKDWEKQKIEKYLSHLSAS